MLLQFTPTLPGTTPPTRTGWYPVNRAQHAHFDADTSTWSELCDDDSGDGAHDAARARRLDPVQVRALQWSGLTRRSAEWLAAEMAAEPAQ